MEIPDENIVALSTFDRLYQALGDSDRLYSEYDAVLKDLFREQPCQSGETVSGRILWTAGKLARQKNSQVFKSVGVYLWGAENCPLCLGMTADSFRNRFNRYIWDKRSQCKLAQQYETELIKNGIDGFPVEIKECYSSNFTGIVRLAHAVRFAEEGIDKIWFALFPHNGGAEIRELERALIPVAMKWNVNNRCGSLLNARE